jgi:hypothetical protein
MEFSAEKVLKNRFSKKFRRIFCGKCFSTKFFLRKIGPRWVYEKAGQNVAQPILRQNYYTTFNLGKVAKFCCLGN